MSSSIVITILGTGPSVGIPVLGCKCSICCSPVNFRMRSSILLQYNNKNILIDTSPDLRFQLLKVKLEKIHSILYTHAHFDHIGGMGDIIPLIRKNKKDDLSDDEVLKIFSDSQTNKIIYNNFSYILKLPNCKKIKFNLIEKNKKFDLFGLKITPIVNNHGEIESVGYIFEKCAYITDFKYLSQESISILRQSNIELLIISCLDVKGTTGHADMDQVMFHIKEINFKGEVYLTHLGHSIDISNFASVIDNYKKKYMLDNIIKPALDNMLLQIML
ncbi:MBL fold metallo-hydrolase [Anaplasmataceae bacterium AB001_6]|nr:MBL fold metallo-hydrolase [Anaplasmataceae bacterium AB001_6]